MRPNRLLLLFSLFAAASQICGQRAPVQEVHLFSEVTSWPSEVRTHIEAAVQHSDHVALMQLQSEVFDELRTQDRDNFGLTLPLPSGDSNKAPSSLHFELERFFVHAPVFKVGVTSERGFEEKEYAPQLQTFKLKLENEVVGTLVLMSDHILGSFHHNGQQFDVAQIEDSFYAVMDFNKRTNLTPFACAVEDAPRKEANDEAPKGVTRANDGGCVEVAIDVDFHTYQIYGNMANATEWALAQMAGVEAIYTQELNGLFFLQVSYVHLWQTPDPMSNFVNDAGAMLDNFRSTWEGTASLDAVQRDVTHLMTRRGNTGTGGIAYLSVNCGSFAYGFSAGMTGSTTNNINSYSWNLDVVSHELGHNFGANHTHWCGWPGGAIDNCYPAEGGCDDGPAVSNGTIMSYCHIAPSTPKVLQFHPLVENNALIPSMSAAGCYGGCEGWTPPECAITDISGGNQQACDPVTLTYTQQVIVTHEYAPADGWLIVNGEQKAIFPSPQVVNLVGQPADGQNVNVSAYFTSDESCALSKSNAYTRRDPCCGLFRMTYVDPDANILQIRNESECPAPLDNWGMLSPVGYKTMAELVTPGQSLLIDPGATVQISWADGLSGDWIMLFLPTDVVYDYLQWGSQAPANIYFQQYAELETVWPGGSGQFVSDIPPYTYIGSGEYGVDQWSGQDVPCNITNLEVVNATECDPATNTYDVTFQVDWVGTPDTGGLSINGEVYLVNGNTLTSTLTLPANGEWIGLNAVFVDEATCEANNGNAYFGPPPCSSCPADINGNGAIEVSDVLTVLSNFGCATDCNALTDLDGDGSITVADVLVVLSAFGEDC